MACMTASPDVFCVATRQAVSPARNSLAKMNWRLQVRSRHGVLFKGVFPCPLHALINLCQIRENASQVAWKLGNRDKISARGMDRHGLLFCQSALCHARVWILLSLVVVNRSGFHFFV